MGGVEALFRIELLKGCATVDYAAFAFAGRMVLICRSKNCDIDPSALV